MIALNYAKCVYANDFELAIKARSDEAVKGCNTLEDKVRTLRQYVHKTIRPPQVGDQISDKQCSLLKNYYTKIGKKRADNNVSSADDYYLFRDNMRFHMSTIDKITLGYGWCDDMAVIFMHLAQKQDIRTRYVQLSNNERTSSPHTIAEAWDGNKWVIVDPLFDLEFENNKLISRPEIVNDLSILRDSPSVKGLVKTDGARWKDDDWLKIYTNPPWAIVEEQEAIKDYTQF